MEKAKELGLKEGSVYTFKFVTRGNSERERSVEKKRMRLIKCYPNIAQFENQIGIKQSFNYWEIRKLLRGEVL